MVKFVVVPAVGPPTTRPAPIQLRRRVLAACKDARPLEHVVDSASSHLPLHCDRFFVSFRDYRDLFIAQLRRPRTQVAQIPGQEGAPRQPFAG